VEITKKRDKDDFMSHVKMMCECSWQWRCLTLWATIQSQLNT